MRLAPITVIVPFEGIPPKDEPLPKVIKRLGDTRPHRYFVLGLASNIETYSDKTGVSIKRCRTPWDAVCLVIHRSAEIPGTRGLLLNLASLEPRLLPQNCISLD